METVYAEAQEQAAAVLRQFLGLPLDSGDAIFERFAALPGAVCGCGSQPLQRYVYLPGTRKDRVVLVAHMDTVWDRACGKPCGAPVLVEQDGVFYSGNPACGIGADDRAGCAMLWALRDSGHSLLVVDGEAHGKIGAQFLRSTNPALFRELNRHRFMLELDWRGTGKCLYHQVENTQRFKRHITQQLGFAEEDKHGACDLQILCRSICGCNVAVGYYNYRTAREFLRTEEWEKTRSALEAFLRQRQPRFKTSLSGRVHWRLTRCSERARALLRRRKGGAE